jgi:hypothetical protein
MHAGHGKSGRAEWPGLSQNIAKAHFGTEKGDLRRHELMSSPRDLGPGTLDLYLARSLPHNSFYESSTELPKSTTCFVITRKARASSIITFPTSSGPHIRVRVRLLHLSDS